MHEFQPLAVERIKFDRRARIHFCGHTLRGEIGESSPSDAPVPLRLLRQKLVQFAVSRDGERHLYKVVAGICGKLFVLFILL
jgi:hypothetical protein